MALVPDNKVKRRYQVGAVTIWRWTNDPKLDFPKPIQSVVAIIGAKRSWTHSTRGRGKEGKAMNKLVAYEKTPEEMLKNALDLEEIRGMSLEELVPEIISSHEQVVNLNGTATCEAIRNGKMLLKSKNDKTVHGQWTKWLKANVPFSVRTAQDYMNLYKKVRDLPPQKRSAVALLPQREAIAATRAPSQKTKAPSQKKSKPEPKKPVTLSSDEQKKVLLAHLHAVQDGLLDVAGLLDLCSGRWPGAKEAISSALGDVEGLLEQIEGKSQPHSSFVAAETNSARANPSAAETPVSEPYPELPPAQDRRSDAFKAKLAAAMKGGERHAS